MTAPDTLTVGNRRRTEDAAQRAAHEAREALKVLAGIEVPEHIMQAGRLRIDHPTATLGELAGLAGVSRDVFRGRLRTLLVCADRVRRGEPVLSRQWPGPRRTTSGAGAARRLSPEEIARLRRLAAGQVS